MAKNIANENIFGGLTGAPEAQTRPAPKTVPVDGAEVVIQQPGAKETRTARMQFILPPSLKTRITRAAKEQGVSVNELCMVYVYGVCVWCMCILFSTASDIKILPCIYVRCQAILDLGHVMCYNNNNRKEMYPCGHKAKTPESLPPGLSFWLVVTVVPV